MKMTDITWEMVVQGTNDQLKADLENKKEKYDTLVRKKNHFVEDIGNAQTSLKILSQEILDLKGKLANKSKKKKNMGIKYKQIQEALDVQERKYAENKCVMEKCNKKLKKIGKKLNKMKSSSLEELRVSKMNKKLKKDIKALESSSRCLRSSLETLEDASVNSETAKIVCPVEVPFRNLVEILSSYISNKESSLECPVCYDVPCLPIYRCPNNHIICKVCLPRLGKNAQHVALGTCLRISNNFG